MFARNTKWIAFILSAALISCSQQDDLLDSGVADGTEITTTVSLKTPAALGTRSVPDVYDTTADYTYFGESGMPSIGNLDLKDDPLTFTVGIYVEKKGTDGNSVFTLVNKQDKVNVQNDEAYFNFRLLKGQTYRIVAYADYSGAAQQNLENIDFTKPGLNRERDDAFFVSEDFVADEHVAAVLKRPFGKLRLIARDFNTFAKGGKFKFTNVKVTYKNQGSADGQNPMLTYNRFNALSKDFCYVAPAASEGEETPATPATPTVTTEYTSAPAVYGAEYGENGEAAYATVFTMYLPANLGDKDTSGKYAPVEDGTPVPQSWMYPFDVEVTYENTEAAATTPDAGDTEASTPEPTTVTRSFAIDIPVKRNWLTTVDAADFWTDNSEIKVSVDPRFDGFINAVPEKQIVVHNMTELRKAVADIKKLSTKTGKIILDADIEWTYEYQDIVLDYGTVVYLDLNGHTIQTIKNGGSDINRYADVTNVKEWKKTYEAGKGKDLSGDELTAFNQAKELLQYYKYIDNDGNHFIGTDGKDKYNKSYPFQSFFQIWDKGSHLIIDDSQKNPVGGMKCLYADITPIYCLHGGAVTINAGNFVIAGDNPAVYSLDNEKDLTGNKRPSVITINGGWFENLDGTTSVTKKDKNGNDIVRYYYETLINIYNDGKLEGTKYGYGIVHLNGGSYVDFDPAQNDNIIGDATNKWVNPETHTILKETINGHTVHTVIAKDNPSYY